MSATHKYLESDITTQQRGKLIVMLYDGAIKFLKVAKQKMEERDYALKGVYIGKARDIIVELNNSLDMESGVQLAKDLRTLYNFMCRHLSEANIERDPVKIDECLKILHELRHAWEEVAQSHQGPSFVATETPTGYSA